MINGKLPDFFMKLGNFRIEIRQLSISPQYHNTAIPHNFPLPL